MLHIDDESIEINGETKHLMAETMCLLQAVYEEVLKDYGDLVATLWLKTMPDSILETAKNFPMSEHLWDDPYLKMLGDDNNDY